MSKKHSVLFVRGILILALVIALAAVVTGFAVPAQAEDAYVPDVDDVVVTDPHIIHVKYTDYQLYALVELPEDGFACFMRVTFFLPGNTYFVIVQPIAEDGTLDLRISCYAEYISMEIVDRLDALVPGTYGHFGGTGFMTHHAGFDYE